ncbi:uncharacterized protein LOC129702110 isoform X1 [Leucoraja erinacea]|uniref:uncharacterized protein LOC129702110 isoform X1 n=1 Tax=Leucoraja erinaceus TaxID=7782 RepID=UPI002454B3A7|nr:uncharacterized protein LOC129702110 isoform X1 [Leucoraja erinacea]XP_055499655.1 uncharacterized protein LOC129702110 isoform X1 [Leucoraja erinacea]
MIVPYRDHILWCSTVSLLNGGTSSRWNSGFSLMLPTLQLHPTSIILNVAGTEAALRAQDFYYTPEHTDPVTHVVTPAESISDPVCLLRKFRDLCQLRTNVIMEHHKFFSLSQQEGETVKSYIGALKNIASRCHFQDREVRNQLFWDEELTHDKVERACRVAEYTDTHTKALGLGPHSAYNVHAFYLSPRQTLTPQQSPKPPGRVTDHLVNNRGNCGGSHPQFRDSEAAAAGLADGGTRSPRITGGRPLFRAPATAISPARVAGSKSSWCGV